MSDVLDLLAKHKLVAFSAALVVGSVALAPAMAGEGVLGLGLATDEGNAVANAKATAGDATKVVAKAKATTADGDSVVAGAKATADDGLDAAAKARATTEDAVAGATGEAQALQGSTIARAVASGGAKTDDAEAKARVGARVMDDRIDQNDHVVVKTDDARVGVQNVWNIYTLHEEGPRVDTRHQVNVDTPHEDVHLDTGSIQVGLEEQELGQLGDAVPSLP